MPVLTCQEAIRFTVGEIAFTVQFSPDPHSKKTRYYIEAPDVVRFERVKVNRPAKAPIGAHYR